MPTGLFSHDYDEGDDGTVLFSDEGGDVHEPAQRPGRPSGDRRVEITKQLESMGKQRPIIHVPLVIRNKTAGGGI